VGFLRVAAALRPECVVYIYLGNALKDAGRLEEALAAHRRAVELDGANVEALCFLGRTLQAAGRTEEALASLRRAVERDPGNGWAYYQLGDTLWASGDAEEAIPTLRKAAELHPGLTTADYNLGLALMTLGEVDEAVAAFRRSIRVRIPIAAPYYHLGLALQAQGDLDEAITAFRQAAERDPNLPAHETLAAALLKRGRFAEARAVTQHCLGLPPAIESRREAHRQQIKLCEQLLAREARLSAIRRGEARPADAAEQRDLARLCQDYRREYAAAARFYAGAFVDQPGLAEELSTQDRYRAARAAALAGCGRGEDGPGLGDAERSRLRRQAQAWLKADADAWAARLARGKEEERIRVGEMLQRWRREADLAGVRGPQALEKLPEEEREEWRELWARVEGLLARTPPGQLGLAREHMDRREWAHAADCYAKALQLGATENGHFGFEYAALLLLSGDREGYAAVCARMAERCKPPNLRPYHVARACTLASAPPLDPALPAKLATTELRASARQPWSLTEQAALHCRAGRSAEAVPLLRESLRGEPRPGRAVLNWLWLALAHQHQGRPEEARRWLDKARRWMDAHEGGFPSGDEDRDRLGRDLHSALEAQALRREAEALLAAR
jgi:tetratricopeptide (TPR) repeat protein